MGSTPAGTLGAMKTLLVIIGIAVLLAGVSMVRTLEDLLVD